MCQMASHVWQIVTVIYTDTVFVHLNMCKQLHVTSKQLTENILSNSPVLGGNNPKKNLYHFQKIKCPLRNTTHQIYLQVNHSKRPCCPSIIVTVNKPNSRPVIAALQSSLVLLKCATSCLN